MVIRLEARSDNGFIYTFLYDAINSGFYIKDIEGLDPVKANLVTSSYANLDGTQYQSSRRESRTLVLKIGMEEADNTIQEQRRRLYNVFMPKSRVSLRFFMADGLVVDISGRVETNDASMFTREPTMTVSILCFDPDFEDSALYTVSGGTTSGTSTIAIPYIGTVDTGFIFRMTVNRNIASFSLNLTGPDNQTRVLEFVAPLLTGDLIRISTKPGDKWARRTRSGSVTSLLYGVSPYSDWLRLAPGTNALRVSTSGAAIPFTLEYTDKYGAL